LISIKKYLDGDAPTSAIMLLEPNELLTITVEAYRSALRAIGRSAVEACPAPGRDLERGLASLEARISSAADAYDVKQTEAQVETQLLRWGVLTAEYLKGQADEVKELLIMLASTAESVGERDQRYTVQFGGLTAELKAIANLDDLTLIRSSLVQKAAELKSCVDQMTKDGQNSLAQLRTKVSGYQSKLKAVELLASKDTVTGLANRRSMERRLERNVAGEQTFCLVLLDLNEFKKVNDMYGHPAGDELLKKNNVRSDDLVGRGGGDEFVVVLSRNLGRAMPQIERIRDWVLGSYSIVARDGGEELKIRVDASIGVAEWTHGKTVKQLIQEADTAMYEDKVESRR
jgi:diguanylate cyclase (GGDEF)-like protein